MSAWREHTGCGGDLCDFVAMTLRIDRERLRFELRGEGEYRLRFAGASLDEFGDAIAALECMPLLRARVEVVR